MKLCLSCLGSSSSKRLPKQGSDHHRNIGLVTSIIEFIAPTCSRKEKSKWKRQRHEHHEYHQLKMVKKTTLEELLFSDDKIGSNGEEYNKFFGHFFKRICPPFTEDFVDFTMKSRESVSLERLLKVEDQLIDSGELTDASISTSQSGIVRKRVSFKFPSEADIIIFYSSDAESDQD